MSVAAEQPLRGLSVLVTSGPTREPIDPVRFLSNRSSGKTGYAIAGALVAAGARTVVVTGPTAEPAPSGVELVHVETAVQMYDACLAALPVDIAVCVAAVSDWRVRHVGRSKFKKEVGRPSPVLELVENPDILHRLSRPGPARPRLVIGFAGETDFVLEHATAKLQSKGCDWILANDVSVPGVFGGDDNRISLIRADRVEAWPMMAKRDIATELTRRIVEALVPR